MRNAWLCATVFNAALLLLIGSAAGRVARAQYSRRTPIVEAVQKTRAGIVTVKVEKKGAWDRTRESEATGAVVDERGYVVTNRHLVATATSVRIGLVDGTELPAQILAEEPQSDLAILRVRTGQRLQALPLGPGSDLMVGETVIAVGHPYGYTHTVSTGIVSAVGRRITIPTGETLCNLIQTDASINPGSSGGPLLNINGELIGIIFGTREGAQGIAFAINVDTVKQLLVEQLSALKIAGVTHGLTCAERALPGWPLRHRVIVAGVTKQSPAALAGLKRGDEILRVGQQAVSNRFDVERALWDRKPGESITWTLIRQGKEMSIALTLTRASEGDGSAASQAKTADPLRSKARAAGQETAGDPR